MKQEEETLPQKFIPRRKTRRLHLSAASRSSSNTAVYLETLSGASSTASSSPTSATPTRAGVIVGAKHKETW